MSVGCAQCHDHRYDPISQIDYYRMRSIFEPAYDWKNWRAPRSRLLSLYTDEDRKQAAEIEAEAKKIDEKRTVKQNEFIQATLEKELAKLPDELRETVRGCTGNARSQADCGTTKAAQRTSQRERLRRLVVSL